MNLCTMSATVLLILKLVATNLAMNVPQSSERLGFRKINPNLRNQESKYPLGEGTSISQLRCQLAHSARYDWEGPHNSHQDLEMGLAASSSSSHEMQPIQTSKESKSLGALKPEKEDCAICLEEMKADTDEVFPWPECGHTYHKICIQPLVDSKGNCPKCRAPFPKEISTTDQVSVPPTNIVRRVWTALDLRTPKGRFLCFLIFIECAFLSLLFHAMISASPTRQSTHAPAPKSPFF
ncbi:hypothetical protein PGT21_014113 [Puccinia graminis f. sp. tritici]|uniref:RING-type domain-containing protein n=1 Tax=Puccinia graminis f. sp. tritici TaxID=56615 RepID=A0A5B0QN98_PUCGR|nr:hypothetical protein PGT21_014113 [Puccinia graminis f. sp. tritici]